MNAGIQEHATIDTFRLRMNMDLRNSASDGSQRMLNAIEQSSETVVCLRGRLMEEFYDELERRCTEAIELSPGGLVVALNIPIGQWHTVRDLESGTVIMEVKDGPYEPTGEEDILLGIGLSTSRWKISAINF